MFNCSGSSSWSQDRTCMVGLKTSHRAYDVVRPPTMDCWLVYWMKFTVMDNHLGDRQKPRSRETIPCSFRHTPMGHLPYIVLHTTTPLIIQLDTIGICPHCSNPHRVRTRGVLITRHTPYACRRLVGTTFDGWISGDPEPSGVYRAQPGNEWCTSFPSIK